MRLHLLRTRFSKDGGLANGGGGGDSSGNGGIEHLQPRSSLKKQVEVDDIGQVNAARPVDRRVHWRDGCGNDLAEVREFDAGEEEPSDEEREKKGIRGCAPEEAAQLVSVEKDVNGVPDPLGQDQNNPGGAAAAPPSLHRRTQRQRRGAVEETGGAASRAQTAISRRRRAAAAGRHRAAAARRLRRGRRHAGIPEKARQGDAAVLPPEEARRGRPGPLLRLPSQERDLQWQVGHVWLRRWSAHRVRHRRRLRPADEDPPRQLRHR